MVAEPVEVKVILKKDLVMDFERLKNEIKERVDIVELVKSSGVHLKKNGKAHMGLCPFHEDRKPSLAVYPETGSWDCFGCGKGGDAISWGMEMEKVDFKEYVMRLAGKVGIDVGRIKDKGKRIKSIKDKDKEEEIKEKEEKERRWEIYRLAARVYAKNLEKHPEVMEYLVKERGLTEETIKKYGIGFCDGKGHLFEDLRKKGFSEKELVESGIFYEDGREVFAGYIALPNIVNGKVVYLTGRVFEGKRIKEKGEKEKLKSQKEKERNEDDRMDRIERIGKERPATSDEGHAGADEGNEHPARGQKDRMDRIDKKGEKKKYLKPRGVTTEHLFNEGDAEKSEVFLCEGQIDTLTLLQNGYPA